MEIRRDRYLNQLISRMGNGMVKVISGVHGCGKSYLMFILFERYLLQHGVDKEHIIEIALEGASDETFCDPRRCFEYIKDALKDDGRYYVLMDGVQLIPRFEEVLNVLSRADNADIYMTAGNCAHFSRAAAGLLAKIDEVRLYPLSFCELHSAFNREYEKDLQSYMLYGGLPRAFQLEDSAKVRTYLKDMYLGLCTRDVVEKNALRSAKEALALVRVLASSVGVLNNPTRIANAFKVGARVSYTNKTVSKHIDYLEEAFLISKARRFDIGSRKYVGGRVKYYFTDIGMRSAILDFAPQADAQSFENIVYNELLVQGYDVGTGVLNVWGKNASGRRARCQLEVDFVANKGSQRYYIQLACGKLTAEKLNRKILPLCAIRDAFKRIVIVDGTAPPWRTDEGFVVMGMKHFLTDPQALDF